MIDEGYIKFNCTWDQSSLPEVGDISDLLEARNTLFQKKLIGYDTHHKVGYGNISKRISGGKFLISGTQTGHIEKLDSTGYSFIESFNIDSNSVVCSGPAKASSESLTHASIYLLDADINAVVHVHNKKLWEFLLNKVPTTGKDVSYGTPAMARETGRLAKEETLLQKKIFVMAGHEDGVISFGKNMKEAMDVMLGYFNSL